MTALARTLAQVSCLWQTQSHKSLPPCATFHHPVEERCLFVALSVYHVCFLQPAKIRSTIITTASKVFLCSRSRHRCARTRKTLNCPVLSLWFLFKGHTCAFSAPFPLFSSSASTLFLTEAETHSSQVRLLEYTVSCPPWQLFPKWNVGLGLKIFWFVHHSNDSKYWSPSNHQ